MFNAIKAKFPTALLQTIPKSLSQITPNLPSLSPVSPVHLPVACLYEYLIVKTADKP
jgi:hypothetical protein